MNGLDCVFVGNSRTGDLKQIDFRAPAAPKTISVVDNTRKLGFKTLKCLTNATTKQIIKLFSHSETQNSFKEEAKSSL